MASADSHEQPPEGEETRQRRRRLTALLAAGIALVAVAVFLGVRFRSAYIVVSLGVGWLGLIYSGLAFWQFRVERPEETSRLLVLLLAGATGLIMTLVGVGLAWQWWETYLAWLRAEPGKDAWRMWVSLLLAFAGLAIMFVGLQGARGEERTNPTLRRLLYGYNAALTGLLVLAILAVVNVLAYAKLPEPINFTASAMYELSSRSKSILQGLDKPTKVYVIMSRNSLRESEMQTLLSRCRDVNKRIEVEYLDPDLDLEQLRDLIKRYSFTARVGVLIVYGTPPDQVHHFLGIDDLYTTDFAGGSREEKFKGEDALMTAFASLEEGKGKPVLYFTQGHGELDLNDSTVSRPGRGAGLVRSRLEKRSFDVKPLNFKPADPRVPDDATIVVIARPATPFTSGELKALRDYMNPADGKKKGKLFILLSIELGPDNKLVRTGLESFLTEFSVRVGNERILSLQDGSTVLALFNPRLADRNAVAGLFERKLFDLRDVRPVEPAGEGEPGAPSKYTAETLVLALAQQGLWLESNLTADPAQLAASLRTNRQELEAKLSERDIPMAVAVTEASAPSDPHAFMRQPVEGTPRLAVFGNAALASNDLVEKAGGFYYEIVANTLDWLRGRPQSIGIEPKTRNVFTLAPEANTGRMILLPAALMVLTIVGLGAGIWAVRRK
jgi:hypothetical protein